jgi:hypothetical protein
VTAFDAFRNAVAQALTDTGGHFFMRVFAGTPYQLHALIPRPEAVSAPPVEIHLATTH